MEGLDEKFEKKLKEKREEKNTALLSEISLHLKSSDENSTKLLSVISKQNDELTVLLKNDFINPKEIVRNEKEEMIAFFKIIQLNQKEIIDNQEKLLASLNKKPKRLNIVRSNLNSTIEHIDIEWNN